MERRRGKLPSGMLCACRRKLTSEPRDKVFTVLGILPGEVWLYSPRSPDYSVSLKEVYINVVDFLLRTTRRLDVICEAIYFPLRAKTDARSKFLDSSRRAKLEISAIYLDRLARCSIAARTRCGLDDSLMAFPALARQAAREEGYGDDYVISQGLRR
ncbi:hypothetical protein F4779DRAFT_620627 [Xylariaceae sp. FL0662B]|nr:hypothetical protein F4779DRAFT_620627 [Xylariaceae sp. FL0662B]